MNRAPLTAQQWLAQAEVALRSSGIEEPELEARWFLEEISVDFSEIRRRELRPEEITKLQQFLTRRVSGEPFAYVIGHRGFYGLDFLVGPGVLIPRPETELVVEVARQAFALGKGPRRIADLGAGSGCIGLTLLKYFPEAHLTAIEASATAVGFLRRNALRLGVSERVEILSFPVEKVQAIERFDLIVANPPYIDPMDPDVADDVRKYEPHEALFSGSQGLACIRSWSAWAHQRLAPQGRLVMEVGRGQSSQVAHELASAGKFVTILVHKDLSGIERVVSARHQE